MAPSDRGTDQLIPLRGGLVIPADAYRLLLDLEARGFTVRPAGDTTLVVQPGEALTPEDRISIRRWKWHLLMLLDYCAHPSAGAHLPADAVSVNTERHP